MTRVTTALNCPSWCAEHERDLSATDLVMVHRRRIGQVEVSITATLTQEGWLWANQGKPTLDVPDLDQLTQEECADISDDLQQLTVILDGITTTLR